MDDRFIVPQFIDSEDKIWGPITVRQFIIVLIGGLLEFIAYKAADFSLFLFESVIIILLVALFAFYKVNGRPFHIYAVNFIASLRVPRLRIWSKEFSKTREVEVKDEDTGIKVEKKPFIPHRKLSELSLIIDTGGAYKGEESANMANHLRMQEKQSRKKDIL